MFAITTQLEETQLVFPQEKDIKIWCKIFHLELANMTFFSIAFKKKTFKRILG